MDQGISSPASRVIAVDAIAHTYPGTRKVGPRTALDGVSLNVRPGEVVGLLGPNGGGKSTLLKILSTYLTPTSGRATILGMDVVRESARVRARIGVLFQSPSIDLKLTVRENLQHMGYLYGLHGADLAKRVDAMLERMRLAEYRGSLAETLSGGLQRRTEIAKSLLHTPDVLLLDEPSTGLDPAVRRDLWSFLYSLRDELGMTILFTTHIMEEAEGCDRLVMLDRGHVVAEGTPLELKSRIGGDVITVTGGEATALAAAITAAFNVTPTVVDGSVRIELSRGHEFVPRLVEAFPQEITSINLSKPTLEDVFVHYAGRRFAAEEQVSA